jgi:large repetitive protein
MMLAADLGWSSAMSINELVKLTEEGKERVEPTHHYFADGQNRGMVILSDRIALRTSEDLAGPQAAELLETAGLSQLRPLDGGFSVYASQSPIEADTLAGLKSSGLADAVAPVFGIIESQSEAVLLNEVIISLPQGVSAQEVFSEELFAGYRSLSGTPDQYVATLNVGYGEPALDAINQLQADSRIAWASPNFFQNWQLLDFFPNDPRFPNQWHLHNTGQAGGLVDADPNLPEAWQFFQPGGPPSSIVIGIVDDGVAIDHPDLLNWSNTGESAGDGMDNDGNGWVDDINGWNFVDNDNVSHPNTGSDNHGTAVAGVAAARGNNGIGVTGASYNSSVISSRIFRGNSVASDAGIASAIYYTAGRTANGLGTWPAADIVNHSWGGGGVSTAITGAVTWATTQGRGGLGVPQVFAAGNSFGSVIYPATLSLTIPGVIAVGAMNNQGEKSNFSSFGPAVDIVTPSNDTRSGYLAIDTTDRLAPSGYNSGDDFTGTGSSGFGGTSSAAPLATGIAALAMARADQLGLDLTAAELRSLMRNNTKLAGSTAYSMTTGRNDLMGHGLLNAETLMQGIGRPQISVTTSSQTVQSAGTIDLGSAIVGGVTEVIFRVRNQGTQTLLLSGLTVDSPDFSLAEGLSDTELGLGESTTFTVRFNPTSAGMKSGSASIQSNDDLLPTLQFNLTGVAQATTVSGFFFEDRDGSGQFSPGEPTLANQQVFIDQNANGVFDPNIESIVLTNSTPASILDGQTTFSTINVSGMNASVTDVKVRVNLNHTFVGDLTIALVGPDGTRVQLFNRRGSGGDNLVDTLFDDQAALGIASGTAPFTGSFRPEQPLSSFGGVVANGDWTLEVRDNASADQGTLLNWTLDIAGGERVATTDEFGFYYFLDVPNGSYSLTGLIPEGWTPSGPSQHPFTVSGPNDIFPNRNVGAGKNDRLYARVFNDRNGNGLVDPTESGLGNQTIFLDVNSNGIFDPPQSSTWVNSNQTPITDLSTLNLPVFVSGQSGTISDVNVSLNLNHTWVGDLEISLISPTGSQMMLSNRRGGSGDNFTGTIFDDSAPNSILEGIPPFSGSFRPETALSELNGLAPNGIWTLRIRDLAGGDVGTFLNWTLHLKTESDLELSTDAGGWASLDLPSSTATIALVAQPGWEFTEPSSGSIEVATTGLPIFNQLFGTRQPTSSIEGAFVYHGGWSGAGSAIDSTKVLARESSEAQTLTYENLINTTGGINGVVLSLAGWSGTLSADDFSFQVSPTGAFLESLNPPAAWSDAPAPSSITVNPGPPSQVLIEWPQNAIANRWLRMTVFANDNTRLPEAEVFYVGHLLGETTGPSDGLYTVSFADIGLIRGGIGQSVGASSPLDIDKDGIVAFADISAMRSSIAGQLTNVTIPASGNGGLRLNSQSSPSGGSRQDDSKGPSGLIAAPLFDSSPANSGGRLASHSEAVADLIMESLFSQKPSESSSRADIYTPREILNEIPNSLISARRSAPLENAASKANGGNGVNDANEAIDANGASDFAVDSFYAQLESEIVERLR